MGAGDQAPRDYTNVRGPVLALFEFPRTSLDQLRAEDPQHIVTLSADCNERDLNTPRSLELVL